MQVADNTVVTFHYRLWEKEGEILESSYDDGQPVAWLVGSHGMLSGLARALPGKQAGDSFEVCLEPADAYGPRQEHAEQRVPIKHIVGAKRLKPGMVVQVNTSNGLREVTVMKVGKFNVDVDTNHPFAGKTLHFALEIEAVREASAEEQAHGHAHGPGGHQH